MVIFYEGPSPGGEGCTSSNEKGQAEVPASPNSINDKCTQLDTSSTALAALEIDLSEAARFLNLLDEGATEFTFQTFDDNVDRKDPKLVRILHGTLEEHAETLIRMNNLGAGIYVMVQQGDGRGRRNENVTRIRAVFQEDDGEERPLPLEPHIVNQSSPGKHHRYLLTNGPSVEEFSLVQERLIADYGSDKNAKDPARVLRLPGFYHQKVDNRKGLTGKPFMVCIVHESGALPYTREQILKALPPIDRKGTGSHTADEGTVKIDDRTYKALRSALAFMRADDRELWVRMGLALKKLGDVGRGLWLEWSQTSLEKYNPRDAAQKWESFKPEHTGYRAVFAEAQRQGWVNPSARTKPNVKDQEPPSQAAKEEKGAREKAVQEAKALIDAMNDKDPGVWFEDKALNALAVLYAWSKPDFERAIAKARNAKAGIKHLKLEMVKRLHKFNRPDKHAANGGDLGWATEEDSTEEGEAKAEGIHPGAMPEAMLERYNRRYGVVLHGGTAAILTMNEDGEYEFLRPGNLRTFHKPELVAYAQEPNPKYMSAFDWWLGQHDRRTHGRVVFEPGLSYFEPALPNEIKTSKLNLWRGLRVKPRPGSCSIITDHLFEVWAAGDPAQADYTLNWLAAKVQWLGKKVRTCLVLQGTPGDGKNTIWELVIEPIFGSGARIVTNPSHITGRFNVALRGVVLVCLNEAFWGGGHDYVGILKSLITDPTFLLELKGIDPIAIPNFIDLVLFTNDEWPVRVDPGDRRFCFMRTSPRYKGNAEYFRRLRREVNDATRAAFLNLLLTRDISTFDPEKFPGEHELKTRAKLNSLSPHERFIAELVLEGEFPSQACLPNEDPHLVLAVEKDCAQIPEEWEERPVCFLKTGLYKLYVMTAKSQNVGRIEPPSEFYRSLRHMLGKPVKEFRPRPNDARRLIFEKRSVCEARLREWLIKGVVQW